MQPVVIASANGHQFRNGGTETCVEHAFRLMTDAAVPCDPLEALVEQRVCNALLSGTL